MKTKRLSQHASADRLQKRCPGIIAWLRDGESPTGPLQLAELTSRDGEEERHQEASAWPSFGPSSVRHMVRREPAKSKHQLLQGANPAERPFPSTARCC